MSESRILARERGIGAEDGEERVNSAVKEGRFERGEGRQAKSTYLVVAGSMNGGVDTKAFQEDLQNLGFTPNLYKSKMERRLETKDPLIR